MCTVPTRTQHPTKAICPILLEDFRKITVDKKGETNFFTSQMIKTCMKRGAARARLSSWLGPVALTSAGLNWFDTVTGVNLQQTIQVDDELEVTAYYAGHVRWTELPPSSASGSADPRLTPRLTPRPTPHRASRRSWARPCSTSAWATPRWCTRATTT